MLFLFFLAIFNNFFTIPVVKEKIKLKLALAIPTGAPITLIIEILFVQIKLFINYFERIVFNGIAFIHF